MLLYSTGTPQKMIEGSRMRVSRARRSGALATALLASAAVPAIAQETGDAPPPVAPAKPGVEGARSYTPADFARFAPRTALDMLRQVPGFSIEGVSQERGLGQASATC
jgi:hypothetical protein